ncbi:MAG: hypothetical protein KAV00_00210 [Phycisphaerae bacterium]|nr:hypothetical protein [Phycisphaerae bacterium]
MLTEEFSELHSRNYANSFGVIRRLLPKLQVLLFMDENDRCPNFSAGYDCVFTGGVGIRLLENGYAGRTGIGWLVRKTCQINDLITPEAKIATQKPGGVPTALQVPLNGA